jgi:hypothetical protein
VCCITPPEGYKHDRTEGVTADPRYLTFDDFSFEHNGQNCSYVFFKECVRYPRYLVAVKYTGDLKYGSFHSKVSDVLIKIGHHLIQFGRYSYVYVNGVDVTESLPWSSDSGDIVIRVRDQRHIKIEVTDKFSLSWNGYSNLIAELHSDLHGKICGLMGNADGNPDNDLMMQSGDGTLVMTSDPEEFGNSWMIPGSCKSHVTDEEIAYIHQ